MFLFCFTSMPPLLGLHPPTAPDILALDLVVVLTRHIVKHLLSDPARRPTEALADWHKAKAIRRLIRHEPILGQGMNSFVLTRLAIALERIDGVHQDGQHELLVRRQLAWRCPLVVVYLSRLPVPQAGEIPSGDIRQLDFGHTWVHGGFRSYAQDWRLSYSKPIPFLSPSRLSRGVRCPGSRGSPWPSPGPPPRNSGTGNPPDGRHGCS